MLDDVYENAEGDDRNRRDDDEPLAIGGRSDPQPPTGEMASTGRSRSKPTSREAFVAAPFGQPKEMQPAAHQAQKGEVWIRTATGYRTAISVTPASSSRNEATRPTAAVTLHRVPACAAVARRASPASREYLGRCFRRSVI